ncbi:MAG TPA: YceI family protein [Longimicrobium sp.]|nr:YceI family protein [Longimicrobium sp.]
MSDTINHASTATIWALDPAHTLVEFSAKHMMITTVKGRFTDVKGEIHMDETYPDRSSVQAELGVASINTGVEQRDAHLRSADFLDADAFGAITFASKRIVGAVDRPGETFELVGDLTIRGTTREVKLEVEYEGRGRDPWGGERVSFSATGKIDRRDFGLTWNQALETGGILVGNDIKISVEAQAVRA